MADEVKHVISLPGELTLPAQPDLHFAIRVSDWKRMRNRVTLIVRSKSAFGPAAWTFLGAGVGIFLSLITWFPAYTQMDPKSQGQFGWVGPVVIVVGAACGLLTLICFLAASRMKSVERDNAVELAADMDEIHPQEH